MRVQGVTFGYTEVPGQAGLKKRRDLAFNCEFQDSQGYRERPCFKK